MAYEDGTESFVHVRAPHDVPNVVRDLMQSLSRCVDSNQFDHVDRSLSLAQTYRQTSVCRNAREFSNKITVIRLTDKFRRVYFRMNQRAGVDPLSRLKPRPIRRGDRVTGLMRQHGIPSAWRMPRLTGITQPCVNVSPRRITLCASSNCISDFLTSTDFGAKDAGEGCARYGPPR